MVSRDYFRLLVLCLTLKVAPLSAGLTVATIGSGKVGGAHVENRQGSGPLFDVHNLILDGAGLEFDNIVVPYQRISIMLARNEVDIFTAAMPSELSHGMQPIILLFTSETILVAVNHIPLTSISDLYGKRVAAQRGASSDFFSQHPAIVKYEVNQPEQGIKMLSKGRIDAVLTALYSFSKAVDKNRYSPDLFSPTLTVASRKYWLFYNKQKYNPRIAAAIRASVKELRDNGQLEAAFFRYNPGGRYPGINITNPVVSD